ncbi:MAG: zinc-ribbon domain-containing protein [Deltaproteobacteria bacterium]
MIIECERCRKKFRIDDSLIKSSGSRVRCSKCGNVFFVEREDAAAEDEPSASSSAPSRQAPTGNPAELFSDIEKESAAGVDWKPFDLERAGRRAAPESADKSEQIKNQPPSGFNWDSIALDIGAQSPHASQSDAQKLFEPPTPKEEPPKPQKEIPSETPVKTEPSRLSVDIERLSAIKRENSAPPPSSMPIARRIELNKAKSSGNKLASLIFFVLIALVISAAAWVISVNLGLVPDKSNVVKKFLSKLPLSSAPDPAASIPVSDSVGRWVRTKDGLVYLVSGRVVNKSGGTVNYIKLKATFLSQGKLLEDTTVYAGNTLSERELKTLSPRVMMLKLYRISGDIDFYNPKKLAGLNYGVERGEYVPFIALYPSKAELPGIEYQVSVVDFEKAGGE